MGLSFHDEPSLVDAVSDLQFGVIDNPDQISGMESMSQDGDMRIGLGDPNAGLEMVNISQEGGDGDIGRSDDIQMVYR